MKPLDLIKHAIKAQCNSESKYSHYPVGCALLSSDDKIIYGCNIESAVYPSTLCAERIAIYSALSQGIKKSKAQNFDTVIIDTAGRLHVDGEMMEPCKEFRIEMRPKALRVYG